MSQHTFRVNDTTECRIGFDRPMETFFAQVYPIDEYGERIEFADKDGEVDATLLWVGGKRWEITTVAELERKLKPHVTAIPADIRTELYELEVN